MSSMFGYLLPNTSTSQLVSRLSRGWAKHSSGYLNLRMTTLNQWINKKKFPSNFGFVGKCLNGSTTVAKGNSFFIQLNDQI